MKVGTATNKSSGPACRSMRNGPLVAFLFLTLAFAGCIGGSDSGDDDSALQGLTPPPFLDYVPIEPDLDLDLLMEDLFLPGTDGVTLHARVTRPAGDGPFPIIVQHTPYTAPGCNVGPYNTVEPPAADVPEVGTVGGNYPAGGCNEGRFEYEFARRGYAYAHADLRGTGDSDGCLNLRGPEDIADIGALADGLAAQPWSNGNVGFIGASYPGSTSHMAALSGSAAVKAVVPIVASTSFYHYHHNDGVPYNGNHALGGTNTGYTQQGVTPTANPLSGIAKLLDQPNCPHFENAYEHGGSDQTGAYYEWWQERNLRPLASTVDTPVLMAQGLADWNVKPDHIHHWFNDLPGAAGGGAPKTLIAGQWGHAYPRSASDSCETYTGSCDPQVPYGQWWEYVTAFFDTYLKEIDTGMFQEDVAWVQANDGSWHRSAEWPLQGDRADSIVLRLQQDGSMTTGEAAPFDATWYACAHDQMNMGQTALATAEGATVECDEEPVQSLTFTTPPFEEDTILSGVPLLRFQADTDGAMRHLTVVMDHLDENGDLLTNGTTTGTSIGGVPVFEPSPRVVGARENYGYLNPEFRNGIEHQEAVPDGAYPVQIDFYPQEDFIPAGHSLRITIASNDGGRTIEAYESGTVTLISVDGSPAELELPVRPAHLWGVRLPDPVVTEDVED